MIKDDPTSTHLSIKGLLPPFLCSKTVALRLAHIPPDGSGLNSVSRESEDGFNRKDYIVFTLKNL